MVRKTCARRPIVGVGGTGNESPLSPSMGRYPDLFERAWGCVMTWLGIYTKPNAEGKAKNGIEAARIPAFCPWLRKRVNFRGERYVMLVPLFSRYLFANPADLSRLDRLREIDGVETILTTNGRISRIPDGVIDAFVRAESLGAFDHADPLLKEGESVRIIDGPLLGLIGKVRSGSTAKRVQLMVDYIHQVTVSVDKLERVSA